MDNSRNIEKHVIYCAQANRLLDSGVEGERRTVHYLCENLKKQLVGDYRILVNYNFPMRGTNTLEIDLLVITTLGIFLLEVKNWVGKIEADDDAWYLNGEKRENIFEIASRKAKIIHSHLHNIQGLAFNPSSISVTSLIVLVRGTGKFKNRSSYDSQAVVCLDQPLIHALSSKDFLRRREWSQRLDNQSINLVCDALFRRHQPEKAEIVDNYRLLKKVREADLFGEFEAQNIHVNTKIVRLKRYRLHSLANARVTENTIEHFKRDLAAVNSLGHHPNIIWTEDFFPDLKDYDLYYEVTEPINGQRLDEFVAQEYLQEHQVPLEDQLSILDALCRALQHAHGHQPEPVYHRNICFETVYLTHDSRANKKIVKLADFNFAKFGKHTINPMSLGPNYQNRTLIDKVFTAPEVLKNASDARAYSDIYALGILWYLLAQLPAYNPKMASFDPLTEADKIETLQLPDTARTLLKRMVAYEANQRPQQIEEVAEVIKLLKTEK